jgi:quinohemoprotein ethanol dehydrogenase
MENTYQWGLRILICGLLVGIPLVGLQSQSGQNSSTEDGAAPPSKIWPVVGGDWTNQRYSPLSEINKDNVKNLGAAWVSSKFDEGAESHSTPVVVNGLIYMTAGARIYAFNAKTGETVWSRQTTGAEGAIPGNQGVGYGDGKLFIGLRNDGSMVAMNPLTGEVEWTHQTGENPPPPGQSNSSAPSYADGMVFSGLSGDSDLRGKITALDAKTGKEVWHFYTVPDPGEFGHDTWAQDNDAYKVGGAAVWMTPAIDEKLGLIYFSVGNAVGQYGGENRPGNNLFTCSVVALDIKTGKLRWYYQTVHHDLWEADIGAPVVLFDAQVDGKQRKALAALRADGYLFQLDRETGKPLFPVEERPVPQDAFEHTSPTQPYPVGAETFIPQCEDWKGQVPAGFVLGCMFAVPTLPPPANEPHNILAPWASVRNIPMSYDPQTGYFYVQGGASLNWRRRTNDPYYLGPGNIGGASIPGLQSHSVLAAIDSRTDRVAWKKEMPSRMLGRGALSTAGGLVFHDAGDGNFQALDPKTGDVLWQFQTGAAGGGSSAATYQIDGKEYIVMTSGPNVWAFTLGGTVPPRPAPSLPEPDPSGFAGPIQKTSVIETTSLESKSNSGGHHYFVDEYAFNPYRAQVEVGTPVRWVNNGSVTETIVAVDGSWTTGPINPAQRAAVTFSKPGKYAYICKEHPWAYGQVVVVAQEAANNRPASKADQ